jgi:hypothetical protein
VGKINRRCVSFLAGIVLRFCIVFFLPFLFTCIIVEPVQYTEKKTTFMMVHILLVRDRVPNGTVATLTIATGFLASAGWAALWGCLGCGGIVGFEQGIRMGWEFLVECFVFFLCHGLGRMELLGRSGWFGWIHKRVHWLFSWGSLIGGIGFWKRSRVWPTPNFVL